MCMYIYIIICAHTLERFTLMWLPIYSSDVFVFDVCWTTPLWLRLSQNHTSTLLSSRAILFAHITPHHIPKLVALLYFITSCISSQQQAGGRGLIHRVAICKPNWKDVDRWGKWRWRRRSSYECKVWWVLCCWWGYIVNVYVCVYVSVWVHLLAQKHVAHTISGHILSGHANSCGGLPHDVFSEVKKPSVYCKFKKSNFFGTSIVV